MGYLPESVPEMLTAKSMSGFNPPFILYTQYQGQQPNCYSTLATLSGLALGNGKLECLKEALLQVRGETTLTKLLVYTRAKELLVFLSKAVLIDVDGNLTVTESVHLNQ